MFNMIIVMEDMGQHMEWLHPPIVETKKNWDLCSLFFGYGNVIWL